MILFCIYTIITIQVLGKETDYSHYAIQINAFRECYLTVGHRNIQTVNYALSTSQKNLFWDCESAPSKAPIWTFNDISATGRGAWYIMSQGEKYYMSSGGKCEGYDIRSNERNCLIQPSSPNINAFSQIYGGIWANGSSLAWSVSERDYKNEILSASTIGREAKWIQCITDCDYPLILTKFTDDPTKSPTLLPTISTTNNPSNYLMNPSNHATTNPIPSRRDDSTPTVYVFIITMSGSDTTDLNKAETEMIIINSLNITSDAIISTKNEDNSITVLISISTDAPLNTDIIEQIIESEVTERYGNENDMDVTVSKPAADPPDTDTKNSLWTEVMILTTSIASSLSVIMIMCFLFGWCYHKKKQKNDPLNMHPLEVISGPKSQISANNDIHEDHMIYHDHGFSLNNERKEGQSLSASHYIDDMDIVEYINTANNLDGIHEINQTKVIGYGAIQCFNVENDEIVMGDDEVTKDHSSDPDVTNEGK